MSDGGFGDAMADLEERLPPPRKERLATGAHLVDPPGPPPDPPAPPPAPPPEDLPGLYPCTDLGNSERLAQRHGHDLRFEHKWGKWLCWDGVRWRLDNTGEPMRRAFETARNVASEGPERAKWATKSEEKKTLNAMLALTQSQPGIPVVFSELDADPWLLTVQNGTLDLRTGKLRPHARPDLITKLAPVVYDEGAECPLWEGLLWDAMGANPDLISFLQRAFWSALTGDVRDEALYFFYGEGANGKSTILDTLQHLLGGYACSVAPDLLMSSRTSRHPTELTDLFKARFVVSQETDQNREWNEGLLKRLTGGDLIKARRMKEDFWEFAPTHKLFHAANTRPIVRGLGNAIWRRMKVVPFEVIIPEERRDVHLKKKLLAELPGILRWCVQGCLAWQRNGLQEPKEVLLATADYREQADVLAGFLGDRCEMDPAHRISRKALRKAYEQWCKDVGEQALSAAEYHDRLREHRIKPCSVRDPSPVRGWAGVKLREEAEPAPHWADGQ